MSEVSSKELKQILENSKTIAIVGLSSKPHRDSNKIARYLIEQGYEIFPVNPLETEIFGQKCYPDLLSLPVIPDIVDVFRNSDSLVPIVKECIEKNCKFIFFQLGVYNEEASDLAHENNISTISDHCILIEHRRLLKL